jgi:DNA-binding transcriptional LysR family regulator
MHSWDDYRYFHAVAHQGSFAAAAQTLGVNHSTVARRIQALETKHGVRLFERVASGYEMTEAGIAVLEVIDEMYDRSQKVSRVLQGKDSRLEGRLNLTMPHDLYECCMAEPLRTFQHQNPDIDIHLSVRYGLRDLANREADIAIRLTANPPDYLIGKCFTQLQHGIYQSDLLEVENATPVIDWADNEETPSWASSHFENPKVVLRVDDLSSMYSAVETGMGIARMPCYYPDALSAKSVKRLDIDLPRSSWGVWLLSHIDLRDTARVSHCKQFLAAEIEQLVPLFQGDNSIR